MKILYGIQGTGHGHISRAKELLPELAKYASVDVILSGGDSAPGIEKFIAYKKDGLSLAYDNNGGVSMVKTLFDLRPISFVKDVNTISLKQYDFVVSDYEPISAWAAKLKNIPCVGLSHQASFLSHKTPRPVHRSGIAESILQHFAPAQSAIGFHFKRYDSFVEPPIIRSPIKNLRVQDGNHITVYLSAFHHEVLKDIFAPIDEVDWHIFSPYCKRVNELRNMKVYPISNQLFLDSVASCKGVICNAGFETCAEAMFLGKKLMAIPIQNQYEQQCNAAALKKMGVMTLAGLQGNIDNIRAWLEMEQIVSISEIADPKEVVEKVLKKGTKSAFKYRAPELVASAG
ncbi:glycosyltransferase family protein [Fodinibius sp. Rm-B-1B1-1]|uniref:glycosyltransferase family protein n=1 Tax=Fodinibius alkaliphilus TaxID=3140241 RepID=UPI003159CD1E